MESFSIYFAIYHECVLSFFYVNKCRGGLAPQILVGHDADGALIALGAPNLEGPVGFFPPRYMASPPLNKCTKINLSCNMVLKSVLNWYFIHFL
jgi:hypothetical protein